MRALMEPLREGGARGKRYIRPPGRLAALLLALALLAGCGAGTAERTVPSGAAEGIFTLSFPPIGKGDAFLLETPAGDFYLVDTGKKKDYPQLEALLAAKGVEELAGIFLTHGHKDHAGGLERVLSDFPTASVYLSGRDRVTYQKIDAKALAEEHGAAVETLFGGETLELGGVRAEVWLPPRADLKHENNNSLVLRLCFGDTAFLLMGDAEEGEEAALLSSGVPLEADVLKLGHHGEDDATSAALLRRVRPAYGIISGNEAENPDSVDPAVTARLAAAGVTPYYSQGDFLALDFVSDGAELTIREFEAPLEEADFESS